MHPRSLAAAAPAAALPLLAVLLLAAPASAAPLVKRATNNSVIISVVVVVVLLGIALVLTYVYMQLNRSPKEVARVLKPSALGKTGHGSDVSEGRSEGSIELDEGGGRRGFRGYTVQEEHVQALSVPPPVYDGHVHGQEGLGLGHSVEVRSGTGAGAA